MIDELENIFDWINIKQPIQNAEIDMPLAYQKKYETAKIKLTDDTYILIKEKRRGSIENFVKQAETISRKYNGNYILVFTKLKDNEKKLLLKARIPFIDYVGNMFIPSLGMMLNKELENLEITSFTRNEQVLFVYIMMSGLNIGEAFEAEQLKEKTQVSIATVYRVLKKFVKSGWLYAEHGSYKFAKTQADIFLEAQEYLFNPIKRTIYIEQCYFDKIKEREKKWGYAGTFALSQLTNLSETNKAIAMSALTVEKMINHDEIEYYESNVLFDKKMIEVQLWQYPPIIISDCVDFISLYRSLKGTEDPRVEKELEYLVKQSLKRTIS